MLLCKIYLLIRNHLHVQNSKVTKWYEVKTLPPTSFHEPPSSSWRKCILFISSIALQRYSLRNYIYILSLFCFFFKWQHSMLCFTSCSFFHLTTHLRDHPFSVHKNMPLIVILLVQYCKEYPCSYIISQLWIYILDISDINYRYI